LALVSEIPLGNSFIDAIRIKHWGGQESKKGPIPLARERAKWSNRYTAKRVTDSLQSE